MTALVLGPVLRHVGETTATIWVETSAPTAVTVLGTTARTFTANGHHFALVVVEGLGPGTETAYDVRLGDELVWPPPGHGWPAPRVRTQSPGGEVRLVFGSCRVSVPDDPPWSDPAPRGFDHDALHALALRLRRQPAAEWPDLMLWVGDQVYADEVTPWMSGFLDARSGAGEVPEEEIAGFEDYTRLYQVGWGSESLRWLLSVVPSVMIFDDHDVHDDWNTSAAWREQVRQTPWWEDRITGAFASYWLYQHLGNLSPQALAADDRWRAVQAADGDVGGLLREQALASDAHPDGTQWSYRRDLGPAALVVIDSRAGRVLAPEDDRRMVDEAEWAWVREQVAEPREHLLLASSLPFLLPPALHWLEAWNEAVCAGAWGARAARTGERIRQAADLEHWAAFQHSFRDWARLVRDVAGGPDRPASVVGLSGDVHHAYLARAQLPGAPVWQAVCSPVRNKLPKKVHGVLRAQYSRSLTAVTRGLARRAGVGPLPFSWRVQDGPFFGNQIATLRLRAGEAELELEVAEPGEDPSSPVLRSVLVRRLTG